MRSLSKIILFSAAVLVPMLAVGCSDDENGDNPGSSGTKTEGGDNGSTAGTKNTGGKNNGGSSNGGSSNGGSKNGDGGGEDPGQAGEGPVNHGGAGGDGPVEPSCDLDALEDGGAIEVNANGEIDADLTLKSGFSYTLDQVTEVVDGVTLTIEPCVKILGTAPTAVLGVLPGGKLEAQGAPNAPIIFTSSKEPGERLPGDWGGIIILGNAQVNQPAAVVEGLETATAYGSATDENNDESSGTLSYVRVEYVGRDIDGKGNESNGITFGGVGSGTKVDHVMVSNSIDDCFEWFGGAVNADHLIALNCDDDMFDTDFGYSGHVQFAFGRQFPTSVEKDSNGFEMDTSANVNIDPLTTAQFANVTLCGANSETAPANPRLGAVLRRQLSGSLSNVILTGFDSAALSVRNTTGITPPTDVTMTESLIFGIGTVYDATHDGGATWFEDQDGNEVVEDAPAGFDCYAAEPDPVADDVIEASSPAGDFAAAPYKGAFGTTNWMTGAWVDWSEE